jgi:hypothetical protein
MPETVEVRRSLDGAPLESSAAFKRTQPHAARG